MRKCNTEILLFDGTCTATSILKSQTFSSFVGNLVLDLLLTGDLHCCLLHPVVTVTSFVDNYCP
jgi:hypothetical protein